MSKSTLYRLGGLAMILTAILFVIGGLFLSTSPGQADSGPFAPSLYYIGLCLAPLALAAAYAFQAQRMGRLGLVGYVMAALGAIAYSAPVYALLAGSSGVETWHEVWAFAMTNSLPLGATAFLIGAALFGIATARAKLLPPTAGWLLAAGALVWLVAFWLSMTLLLAVGNLLAGAGLIWMGASMWASRHAAGFQPEPAA